MTIVVLLFGMLVFLLFMALFFAPLRLAFAMFFLSLLPEFPVFTLLLPGLHLMFVMPPITAVPVPVMASRHLHQGVWHMAHFNPFKA